MNILSLKSCAGKFDSHCFLSVLALLIFATPLHPQTASHLPYRVTPKHTLTDAPQTLVLPTDLAIPIIRVQAGDDQREFIMALQHHLQTLDLYSGAIDGVAGPSTWSAIEQFKRAAGLDEAKRFGGAEFAILADAALIAQASASVKEAIRHASHPVYWRAKASLQAGLRAYQNGRNAEAETLYRLALEAQKQLLGLDHPETLRTQGNLAVAINEEGRTADAEVLYRDTLAVQEKVLGRNHLDTVRTRRNLAVAIGEQGRFAEAETLYGQTLAAQARVLGPDDPATLRTKYNLASAIAEQSRHAEAEALIREALTAQERVLAPDHPATLSTRNSLAVVIEAQGRYPDAEALYRETLATMERVQGSEHPDTLLTRNNLAGAIQLQGRTSEAEAIHRQTLATMERVIGRGHPYTLGTRKTLANAIAKQGRAEEAKALYRETLAVMRRELGPEHPSTLTTLTSLADTIWSQGRAEEAEALYRDNLATLERVRGLVHPQTLRTRGNLALALDAQGRRTEAEVLYRETLATLERVKAPNHPATILSRARLAGLVWENGGAAEAEALYRETLASLERVLGSDHPDTLRNRTNLATVIIDQGRAAAAEALLRETLAKQEQAIGPNHPHTLSSRGILARAMRAQGRAAAAEALLRETLATQERVIGAIHRDTLNTRNDLAGTIWAQGRDEEATALQGQTLALVERALGLGHPHALTTRYNLADALATNGRLADALATIEASFPHLPSALVTTGTTTLDLDIYLRWAASEDELTDTELAARTFPAQGYLTYGDLDVALGAQAARRQVADDAAEKVLREFQDAREAMQRLRRNYLDGFNADAKMTRTARERIEADLRATEDRFTKISQQIERDFPALAELELPRALRAEEAQGLLEPGEGLLAYVSSEEHLYAWLVTSEGITWRRMKAPRAELTERVAHLRASLDIDWRAPPLEIAPGCKLVSSNPDLADWPFDLCAAQELQEIVLDDLDLSGIEELIVVPDGPLESLPFAMLVTDREDDSRPRWLIEDHAITTLPTTSSLRALRHGNGATGADNRLPFLGLAPVEFDTTSPDSALRGSPLATLPGTADEVRLLSGLLGAGRDGTVIGPTASEAFSKSTPLDRYRVLSFATHGLLSREAAEVTDGNISEMSLALTAGDGEDGLLTASEVAGLRLDADWVLLSACNTAGGDGDDAQGLSGLARAFFFAGARALMVSHWYIDDAATSQLMAATMERSSNDGETSRAQALRQAQLAMLSQRNHAHPFYWAPFSVVGDNR